MPRFLPNRSSFTTHSTIRLLWESLNLPLSALSSISLQPESPPNDRFLPSSYKLDHLAQACIALPTLAAALLHSARSHTQNSSSSSNINVDSSNKVPTVTISARAAALSFVSERVYTLSSRPPPSSWGAISGLYRARDGGYVRIHGSFVNHRRALASILGVPVSDSGEVNREDVARAIGDRWDAEELERVALGGDAVVVKLRGPGEEWEGWPVSEKVVGVKRYAVPEEGEGADLEIRGHFGRYTGSSVGCGRRPLQGLRVLELSRVIAAPVAGRTLAALGADVLWVTAPHLPDLPALDIDLGRGKRSIQLDFRREEDRLKLLDLVRDADVFLQSYRPGSLEKYGLGPKDLAAVNPGIVYANLSAYAEPNDELNQNNPWATFRGFDSLVQTCSGMNVSEAEHFAAASTSPGEKNVPSVPSRVLPCQALDHGAGYLFASGILAAIYHRDFVPDGFGAYKVDVSLAGVMKYLQSLGQYDGASGFQVADPVPQQYPLGPKQGQKTGWAEDLWETKQSGFGDLRAVKYPGSIDGCEVGWDVMPKKLGSDEPEWLD
ncbi:hypothetical protein D8B26_005431 [Coccidioides posadasii str. Silveira]|uniref:uncharacterized protein n=1 Tax=Coccidioides posadasii (strain RMSCC 757 / Silveira) TaxID=443226 RepID=UPI001BEE2200|nr:hypothetical protein D8B26_005431 [Coccidioides posadasii str. Silveira]